MTPGVKTENQKDEEGDNEAMSSGEATEYRGLVARANYLSVDRLYMKYSLNGLDAISLLKKTSYSVYYICKVYLENIFF